MSHRRKLRSAIGRSIISCVGRWETVFPFISLTDRDHITHESPRRHIGFDSRMVKRLQRPHAASNTTETHNYDEVAVLADAARQQGQQRPNSRNRAALSRMLMSLKAEVGSSAAVLSEYSVVVGQFGVAPLLHREGRARREMSAWQLRRRQAKSARN
jgi:hypothetical protein